MRCKGAEFPLQAVLFDLDGTLIDSKKDIAASANEVRVHFGLERLPEEAVGAFVGYGIMNLLERTVETKDPDLLAEAHRLFQAHYRGHCVDGTRPYPGAFELLEALKAGRIRMAVVSNKPQEFTDLILRKLDMSDYFEVVFGPEATVHKKPHPEPLLTALERIGAKPSQSVMIGDSPVDIEAARAAKMPVGAVTHGYVGRDILNASDPDWLVDHLSELIPILL